MVAAVVILSVIMALMVFVMMVSLKQQTWLLGEMVAINTQLADTTHNLEVQKAQHEAMLVRGWGMGAGRAGWCGPCCGCIAGGRVQMQHDERSRSLKRVQRGGSLS